MSLIDDNVKAAYAKHFGKLIDDINTPMSPESQEWTAFVKAHNEICADRSALARRCEELEQRLASVQPVYDAAVYWYLRGYPGRTDRDDARLEQAAKDALAATGSKP